MCYHFARRGRPLITHNLKAIIFFYDEAKIFNIYINIPSMVERGAWNREIGHIFF